MVDSPPDRGDTLEVPVGSIFASGEGRLYRSNFPGTQLVVNKDNLVFSGDFGVLNWQNGLRITKEKIREIQVGWIMITLIITDFSYDFIQFSPRMFQRKRLIGGLRSFGYIS